jgi:hypothetical protein
MITTNVYKVGLFSDFARYRSHGEWRHFRYWFARPWSRRSYWNGYLAEHEGCAHNAGRGWTRRAAARRAWKICEASA